MKITLICLLFFAVMVQNWYIEKNLSEKVGIVYLSEESQQSLHPMQIAAKNAGLPIPSIKIIRAVEISAEPTGVKGYFLLSLMYTESAFNIKAISSKGYCGLMQIPQKVFDYDANTRIGTDIFVEKLALAKGDYREAIVRYKGWPLHEKEGWKQADKVLKLTRKIKESL